MSMTAKILVQDIAGMEVKSYVVTGLTQVWMEAVWNFNILVNVKLLW